MAKEGKYIYCVIETSQERNFGSIGVGDRGDEVLTIGYEDLSMVVSNYSLKKLVVNRENILEHEKVLEKVMKEFDSVLPVRFGTVASNADEIRNLLDKRYREFKDFLTQMDHKMELGVKGLWKNMPAIFKEIAEENAEIRKAKEGILSNPKANTMEARMEAGRMVADALVKKKEDESQGIINALRPAFVDHKLNRVLSDEMFMNGAFLVDKDREKQFDSIMDDLDEAHKTRAKFIYSGPFPVFNFVNIVIYPEDWEK